MVNQWLMMVNNGLMMVNNGLMMVNDIWLVVTGTMEFYDCPFHIWNNPSHWRTPSFFKMVKTQPTSNSWIILECVFVGMFLGLPWRCSSVWFTTSPRWGLQRNFDVQSLDIRYQRKPWGHRWYFCLKSVCLDDNNIQKSSFTGLICKVMACCD